VPGQGMVVEGVKEVKKAIQAAWNVLKQCQNSQFTTLNDLKNTENVVFYLKVLNKINSRDVLFR
jgi:hypothetical protein